MNRIDPREGSRLIADPSLQQLDEDMAVDILSDGKNIYKTEKKTWGSISDWIKVSLVALAAIALVAVGFVTGTTFAAGIGIGLLAFAGLMGIDAYKKGSVKQDSSQVHMDAGIYRLNKKVDMYNRRYERELEMVPARAQRGRAQAPRLIRQPEQAPRRPALAIA